MDNRDQVISNWQGVVLLTLTILPTAILFLPSVVSNTAGKDAWVSIIVAALFSLVVLLLVTTLTRRFPGKNLFQISEAVLGKFLGKIASLLYIWLFIHITAVVMREFGEFMTIAFMPETPLPVFNIILMLMVAYALKMGLETLARTGEVIFFLITSNLILIMILNIPEVEGKLLLPVLAQGIRPVMQGALVPAAFLGEILLIGVFAPFLHNRAKERKIALLGIAINTFFLALGTAVSIAVFGVKELANFRFPFLMFVRIIEIGGFIERIDALVMVIWISGIAVKTAIFAYAALLGIKEVFGLKDTRPLILPLGVILVPLSILLHKNIEDLSFFIAHTWPRYAISVYWLGLPLLFLLVAILRNKKDET